MAMKFTTRIKHLMGFIVQVTDQKYSVAVLRNDLLCKYSLCPHALFLQAWSHIIIVAWSKGYS